jgi:hypothetical protein
MIGVKDVSLKKLERPGKHLLVDHGKGPGVEQAVCGFVDGIFGVDHQGPELETGKKDEEQNDGGVDFYIFHQFLFTRQNVMRILSQGKISCQRKCMKMRGASQRNILYFSRHMKPDKGGLTTGYVTNKMRSSNNGRPSDFLS